MTLLRMVRKMTDRVRLINPRTKVVISVDVATRKALGAEWVEPGKRAEPATGVAGNADELAPPAGNASREEWAAFAAELGVDVPEGAKRDEIRDLVTRLLDDDSDDESDK